MEKDKKIVDAFERVRWDITSIEKRINSQKEQSDSAIKSLHESLSSLAHKKDLDKIKGKFDSLRKNFNNLKKIEKEVSGISKIRLGLEALEAQIIKRSEYYDLYSAVAELKSELSKREKLKGKLKDIDNLKKNLVAVTTRLEGIEENKTAIEELQSFRDRVSVDNVTQKELKHALKDMEGRLNESVRTWESKNSDEISKQFKKKEALIDNIDRDLTLAYKKIEELESKGVLKKDLRYIERKLDSYNEISRDLKRIAKDIERDQERVKDVETKIISLASRLDSVERDIPKQLKSIAKDLEVQDSRVKDLDRRTEPIDKKIKEIDLENNKAISVINARLNRMKADESKNLKSIEDKVTASAENMIKKESERTDKAIKDIEKRLLEQKKLMLDKAELEKKLKSYRDERIERWRTYLFSAVLGVGIFTALFSYLGSKNPGIFPGLKAKLYVVLIILAILLALTFAPYETWLPKFEMFFFSRDEKRPSEKKKLHKRKEKKLKEKSTIKEKAVQKKGPADKKEKRKDKGKKGFFESLGDFFE